MITTLHILSHTSITCAAPPSRLISSHHLYYNWNLLQARHSAWRGQSSSLSFQTRVWVNGTTATLVTWPRAARVVYNRQLERICALGRFPTSTAAIADLDPDGVGIGSAPPLTSWSSLSSRWRTMAQAILWLFLPLDLICNGPTFCSSPTTQALGVRQWCQLVSIIH